MNLKITTDMDEVSERYPDMERLVRDLCRKATDDAFAAVDRTMKLATDHDPEKQAFLQLSILASVAANFTGSWIDFMYTVHEHPKDIVNLTQDEFTDYLAKCMSQVGGVIIRSHVQKRADTTRKC